MDYTSLVAAKSTSGSIKSWCNNDLVESDVALSEAEQWIYRRLRVRQMVSVADGAMTAASGGDLQALPSDYIEPKWMGYRGLWTGEVAMKSISDIQNSRTYDGAGALATGRPLVYGVRGTTMEFPVQPDQAYTYRLVYYAQPAALSGSNLTNFLTSRAPRLLRCACMAFANEWMKKSDEKTYWLKLAMIEIEQLNSEADLEQSGSTLAIVPQ